MATHSSTLAWKIPWEASVHGVANSRTRLSDFTFPFPFYALEKEMATHSSVLAWRIPGTGGAWRAAVYGVAQSRTRLKRLSSRITLASGPIKSLQSLTSFPLSFWAKPMPTKLLMADTVSTNLTSKINFQLLLYLRLQVKRKKI